MHEFKLTVPQLATLGYIRSKCGITFYGKTSGSKPMKKLKDLGLLYSIDCSYGKYKQTCWNLTVEGKKFYLQEEKLIHKAMDKQGWL